MVDAVLVALLFTPDVDLFSELLVGGLEIVKNSVRLIKLVLELLDSLLVLPHIGCGGPDGLEGILLFHELLNCLLVLVFEDHQSSKIKVSQRIRI